MVSAVIPVYQSSQIRLLEEYAASQLKLSPDTLMQRAGLAAFECMVRHWPKASKIGLFCGGGNNGGDGYELARLADDYGLKVQIWPIGEVRTTLATAQRSREYCQKAGLIQPQPATAEDLNRVDLIVDAITGIGFHGQPRPEIAGAISLINSVPTPVLSLDLPSGLEADTGCVHGEAVKACVTLSFVGLKLGLVTGRGVAYAGKLLSHHLELPIKLYQSVDPICEQLQSSCLSHALKPRARDAYKGDAGHVLLIGGEAGFTGAIRLAAEAALRVGAGLVSLATRPEHAALLNLMRPEIMSHGVSGTSELEKLIAKADVLVLGPGLGQSSWAKELYRTAMRSKPPLIVDADGLNLLAQEPTQRDNWILTPHVGEAARLLNSANHDVMADRLQAVKALQAKYQGVAVLKGAGTLVQAAGMRTGVCPYGNPGMASGGMGDVLSGVIAGLLAQGLTLAAAAKLGVCVHALAGDEAARAGGERGMLASDLMPFLRKRVNIA